MTKILLVRHGTVEGIKRSFVVSSVFDKDNEGDSVTFTASKGTINQTSMTWSWTPGWNAYGAADQPPRENSFATDADVKEKAPVADHRHKGFEDEERRRKEQGRRAARHKEPCKKKERERKGIDRVSALKN